MNPIFLDLGIIQIYWYSIFILLGFLIGGTLALWEARRWEIPEDFMINLFFYVIIFAFLGARIYYILFNLEYYMNDPISMIKVWEGGLAIHGGIIACTIFIIFYTKKYKVNTLRILDILAVSLIIGQAIGRWGNFFNQEAYGSATTLEFLKGLHLPQFIIDGMFINGTYYQPTFLYESIGCLLGFIVLLIFRCRKHTKVGYVTALYLIWYGVLRFFIESLRQDSLMLGNFKMAQIVSIILVISGIIIFIRLRKVSVFDNSYNGRTNE